MFVIANLLIAVARIADILLTIYLYLIIGRAIISWVNADPYNPIVSFLYRTTEPVLARIRRKVPYLGGLDISPMIVILAILFLQKFAINSLYDMGYKLKMGGGLP